MRADVHRHDRVGLLLVGDDRRAARLDEAVVVEVEVDAARAVAGGREMPQQLVPRAHEEHPVVPAVGDQERAGKRRRLQGRDARDGCEELEHVATLGFTP